MVELTILTPTYNRAYILPNAYESLRAQTNKNFEWLIVDDGSIDNTKAVVEGFGKQLDIKYIYKENGGKHTALNIGFKYARGKYMIILDSDDCLTSDAVETILSYWKKYENNLKLSSVSFLKGYINGECVGNKYYKDEFISNHIECRINHNIMGDKSEVFRSKILKEYSFPVFEGEKFIPEGVIWNKIGKKYDTLYVNKIIYLCEYLDDGLTKNSRYIHINSPNGCRQNANELLSARINFKVRIKQGILYCAYSRLAQKSLCDTVRECNSRGMALLCYLPSFVLYLKWKKMRKPEK